MSARKKTSPTPPGPPEPERPARKAPDASLDQEARRRIRTERRSTLVVDAGAGTGKTTELLNRMKGLLLDDQVPISRVAAITFTDKAAAELSVRLREVLEQAWDERPEKRPLLKTLMRDLETTHVSTVHSFCARILREFPFQAGLDPQFEVMDQVQTEVENARRWEDWLGRALQKEAPELVAALRCGVKLDRVEDLKDFLIRNRTLLSGPPVVPPEPDPASVKRTILASEKTVREILNSGNADTLTKAAGQVLGLVRDLERTDPEDVPYVLIRANVQGGRNLGNQGNWGDRLAGFREAIIGPRQELEDYQVRFASRVLKSLERWLWGFFEDRGEGRSGRALMSFDDLLLRTRDLLRSHAEVRAVLRGRFDHVFVDEFQDTDPLQAQIVALLCSSDERGRSVLDEGKLFVVGDPKQSIYRFRRADLGQYLKIREEVRTAPGGSVEGLLVNFRTVPGVIEWVNGRFDALMENQGFPFLPLAARRSPGPEGSLPPVTGLRIETPPKDAPGPRPKEAEAQAVAAHLKRLLKGSPLVYEKERDEWVALQPRHVAVLFRNLSGYEEEYEEAFRRLEIPFAVVGGQKFYKRPEVAALSTLLSCLAAPAEETLGVAVLRSFLFGFSDEELFRLKAGGRDFRFLEAFEPADPLEERLKRAFDLLGRLRRLTAPMGLSEAIREIFRETDLLVVTAAQPHGAQRVANLQKVRDLAANVEDAENATLRGFAAWLQDRQESESDEEQAPGADEDAGAVRWMTIHKAKGLEFPVVFVAGSEVRHGESMLVDRQDGNAEFSFKSAGLQTPGLEALKEAEKGEREREDARLLYVACTRARDALIIPFQAPVKAGHILAGLCEGWEAASEDAPCDWKVPSGGSIHFTVPPAFPEETADREANVVRLDEADPGSEAVRNAGAEIDEAARIWGGRIEGLHAGPLSLKAHEAAGGDASVEEGRWKEGDGSSMRFGSLVHRLMELALVGDEDLLEAGARAWGAELSLGRRKVREARDLTAKVLDHDLMKRARKSGRFFCEAAAAQAGEDGSTLEGVMDLAFLEDGKWVVVDYKTDRDPERFRDKYEAQLKAYARLLEASTKVEVKEACLFYLRSGEVRPVDLKK